MFCNDVSKMYEILSFISDAFGASRDHRNEVHENQENHCFICGIECSRFDRLGRGFDFHCTNEHNMWSYVYCMTYLKVKDDTTYTGLESYLANQMQAGALEVFPVGRASAAAKVSEH